MPVIRSLLTVALCVSLASAAELRTLAGKSVSGDLIRLSPKEVVLRGDADPVAIPLTEVLSLDLQPVGTLPGTVKTVLVALTDGSQLQCGQVRVKGKTAELTLATPAEGEKNGTVLAVPLAAVSYLVHDAQDPAVRQEWQEKYLAKRGNEDILAIKTANGVQRLEGTFGDGDAKGEKIEFQLGKKTFPIDLARVHGMVFVRKADADLAAPVCRVHDVYRNVLAAAKVELTDERFVVTTPSGAKVEYPRPLVARLDFSGGKLAYLSDLEPVRVAQRSSLGRVEPYRRDKNLDDGPLRLAGEKYAKGLALHSHTELVYELEGKFKEFKAVLGVDDLVGGDGEAVVTIEGDGRQLFDGVVTRKDRPRPLALDVKGVRQLRIVVGSRGLLDIGDHVDLADAKVSK